MAAMTIIHGSVAASPYLRHRTVLMYVGSPHNSFHQCCLVRGSSSKAQSTSKSRTRSRNASTYQRKTLAKRVPRERPNIDVEAVDLEGGKGRSLISDELSSTLVGNSDIVSEHVVPISSQGLIPEDEEVEQVFMGFMDGEENQKENHLNITELDTGIASSDASQGVSSSNLTSAMLVDDSTEAESLLEDDATGENMDSSIELDPNTSDDYSNSLSCPVAVEEDKTSVSEVDDDQPSVSESLAQMGSTVQSLTSTITTLKEARSIGITRDLVQTVKDAEKNILMLNQSRLQALELLEEAHRDKESLLGEVKVLWERLAEANEKLELANQEMTQMKLVEKEVEVLLAEHNQRESQTKESLSQLETQHQALQMHVQTLEENLRRSKELEVELDILKKDKNLLEDEIDSLQTTLQNMKKKDEEITSLKATLFDLSAKEKLLQQLEEEKAEVKSYTMELESRLAEIESTATLLEHMKDENVILNEKIQQLEEDAKAYSTKMISVDTREHRNLQPKIEQLEAAFSKLEAENKLLKQAQKENEVLRDKVKLLEQIIVETDAEIRLQLDVYQTEVESLQTSLEELRLHTEPMVETGSGDDLPWEVWSHLLLSIDAWMLGKLITVEDASKLREMAWHRNPSFKDVFLSKQSSSENEMLSAFLNLLEAKKRPGLHIVHIASEMAPVAKVGGLGDVVAGLGKALQKNGHLVEVLLPKYDCMDYGQIKKLKELNWELESFYDGKLFKSKVWSGIVEGLPVFFIEPHHPGKFFWRGQFYGQADDFQRFTFFSRAALEFLLQSGKKPDIIHCHDWHTAIVAPLYWEAFVPQGLNSARIAFTCHNFEYQGIDAPSALTSCGLDGPQLNRPDRMQDNSSNNRINLVKGAVVYSNIVTTVSPSYAEEVKGPEGGKGLQSTLVAHAKKFSGILNGIDVDAWNPSTDPFLDYQYNADDLTGKAGNKRSLRSYLKLAEDVDRPLVGCITRLVPQKGVHLIRHAIYRTIEQGGQFVLLGASPIHHIQKEFEAIANQFNNHPQCRLILKYDELLSHCIYAASDVFIIPSIFEPCGLTQMISMRYGAIPVARQTGGLNDSVFDVDDELIPSHQRNGFTFKAADEQGLNSALDRSLKYYIERPKWWNGLVEKAMKMDFSWEASAEQYEKLYESALARARSRARA